MVKGLTILLAFIALSSTTCVKPQPVMTAQAACAAATAKVTARRSLPISHVAVCDDIAEADGPEGFYVMALLAHCSEAVCGSTNMGWFAVEKATGDVFDWDVAEWKLGPLVAEGV